jgi:hypothetical protein
MAMMLRTRGSGARLGWTAWAATLLRVFNERTWLIAERQFTAWPVEAPPTWAASKQGRPSKPPDSDKQNDNPGYIHASFPEGIPEADMQDLRPRPVRPCFR